MNTNVEIDLIHYAYESLVKTDKESLGITTQHILSYIDKKKTE